MPRATCPSATTKRQHLELTRTLAERFNATYGATFVVPRAVTPPVGPALPTSPTPTRKMSKSAPPGATGVIRLLDPIDDVVAKIRRAVTDSDDCVAYNPAAKPGVSNLLDILATCTGRQVTELVDEHRRYGDLKRAAADAVVAILGADPGAIRGVDRRGP